MTDLALAVEPTLASELRVALAKSTRRIRSRRGAADLPDPQFNVLAILLREGPLSPGALADAEHVQPPSMTRTVNALVALGFVQKSEHPTDGRQVVVSLTAAGEAEVRETRRRRDAWLAGQLALLTTDERQTLAQAAVLLRRIAAG
ncbi:MarR family winged helix-turn-helix transcriptional regulator [Cellulomonas sp. Marseille-Q8402]